MSEISVFIRQGDPNRASKKGQKRPLSIITENDSDDPEGISYTHYHDGADCNGKENTACCSAIPTTNKNGQDGEIVCKVSEIARIARNSVSDYKSSLRLPIMSCKHHVPSSSFSKLIKIPLVKLPSETRTCALETPAGHSMLIFDNNDKCPDEVFWKQQVANMKSLTCASQDIKINDLLQYNQTSAAAATPTTTTYNDAPVPFNDTEFNSVPSLKLVDVNGVAKIPETPDRIVTSLPLSPALPFTPSPSQNGTFSYRTSQQASAAKTSHEVKNSTSPNSQQLTLNTNGGPPVLVSLIISPSPDSDDSTDKSGSDNSSPSSGHLGSRFSKFASPKFSAYFSRRMSNESSGSLSESDLSDGDIGADDASTYLSYFRRLKETTDKLHLSTRRPSIMLWRQQCLESQTSSRVKSSMNSDISDDSLTLDRKHRIDKALEWLRTQLQEMRSQDQHLARQLLSIRHDIHKLKLQRSTEEHQEMIDDFQFELQEIQELSNILDLPMPEYSSNPLKQIGITRLNISARRFSAC